MPVVQLDEDTTRNAGIELDDNPFAGVEGVRMLKPALEKGKAWSAQENGLDDGETVDGHEGMMRWRVFRPIIIVGGNFLVVLLVS